MDNLNKIAVFVKVVEAGGFTAAARELNMSPSLASRRLRDLEDGLGVQLVHRSTRRIALTEAGEAFYRDCARALSAIETARFNAAGFAAEPRGTLKVHAAVGIGRQWVSEAITEFKLRNPNIAVNLNISSDRVTPIEGGYDVIIRTAELGDSSLDSRDYGPIRYLVAASPKYLARAGTPRRPAELADHECLIHYGRRPPTAWPFIGPDGPYTVDVRGTFWSNNSSAIYLAARRSLGIARIPEYVLHGSPDAGALEIVFDDCVPAERMVKAYFPRSAHLPAKVQAFLDFLEAINRGTAPRSPERRAGARV